MSAKADTWMPLYVADWDADTAHLDCEQDGAYGRLVRRYWRAGPPPDDDAQLARIVRMPLARWRKVRPVVAAFFRIEGGQWRHSRVDREIENARLKREKYVERAAAGGRAKAAKSTSKAVLEGCTSPSPYGVEASHEASTAVGRPDGRAPRGARPPAVKPIPEPEQPTAEIVVLADRAAGAA